MSPENDVDKLESALSEKVSSYLFELFDKRDKAVNKLRILKRTYPQNLTPGFSRSEEVKALKNQIEGAVGLAKVLGIVFHDIDLEDPTK